MIALNETVEAAAEVPFYLPTIADPTTGLTGHVFPDAGGGLTSEVQIMLPGGGWTNATIVKVSEKGFGRYVVRLTAAQCVTAGVVYIRANVATAQPYFGSEVIGTTGGDLAVGVDGYVPFFLPNASDPIFGAPITGYVFSAGEVKICLPNASYVNATVGDIVEIGYGAYALKITAAETANRGKAFIYATATGAQRFEGFVTILGAGVAPAVVVVGGTSITAVSSSSPAVASASHVGLALSRLAEQFKSGDV